MNAEPGNGAWRGLRLFVFASGIAASVLFIVVGIATRLEMYGDGSIFSYAVAAQEAWAFHWHNISGRLFTYIFAYILPEQIVALTRSARAGIAAYGLLFFGGPLLGLLITLTADRSRGRVIFAYACASTACLCPFVFGAPTEMWMAHALFWPTLALCLYAPENRRGAIVVFVALLALVLTHDGAIVLAASILATLFLRGCRDARFVRACAAFVAAMLVWTIVKLTIRPDPYIAGVIAAAALRFIDIDNLAQPAFLSLCAALMAYTGLLFLLRAGGVRRRQFYSALLCAAGLAAFWFRFDRWLLAEARYELRTTLLIGVPIFGAIASCQLMIADEWKRSPLRVLQRWVQYVLFIASPRALAGALALVLLVHAVETAKFVSAWMAYKDAVRALALGSASDAELGSPLFVSSQRIPADLNHLAWNSTTPFLSVLVAPRLQPSRLVVDPTAGYFWLPCRVAKQSEVESHTIPEDARRLVRLHACLHRPD